MMLQLNGKLQNNNLTRNELLENIIICKTTTDDLFEIAKILNDNMGVHNPFFAIQQLLDSKIIINESIKLVDKRNGDIYGLLILSDFTLDKGTPMKFIDPMTIKVLKGISQINGFLFVIDERLRGTNLDKKMIKMSMPYINHFDFIWVGVERDLKSHNYWKHLGMYKILEINEAIFYGKILKKELLPTIYKRIIDFSEHENNNQRN